jgi:hypothetical protein
MWRQNNNLKSDKDYLLVKGETQLDESKNKQINKQKHQSLL